MSVETFTTVVLSSRRRSNLSDCAPSDVRKCLSVKFKWEGRKFKFENAFTFCSLNKKPACQVGSSNNKLLQVLGSPGLLQRPFWYREAYLDHFVLRFRAFWKPPRCRNWCLFVREVHNRVECISHSSLGSPTDSITPRSDWWAAALA